GCSWLDGAFLGLAAGKFFAASYVHQRSLYRAARTAFKGFLSARIHRLSGRAAREPLLDFDFAAELFRVPDHPFTVAELLELRFQRGKRFPHSRIEVFE